MKTARILLLVLAATGAAAFGAGLATGSPDRAVPDRAQAPRAAGIDPRTGGLEVALGEWAISPEARAIRPGRVTLVIRNRGKFRHGLELELSRIDDDRRRRDEGDDDAKSIRLEPGEATRVTVDLAPGTYAIECFVSHHDELGMRGVLEVREDAPLLAPPKRAAGTTTVNIQSFLFKPATLRTTVGKTVTWKNLDAAPHTATAAAFSSPQLGKGGSFRRTFTRAGTYAYICALHPAMRGKVVVTGR
jgi:plastocyanin